MKKILTALGGIAILSFVFASPTLPAGPPLQVGGLLPAINLPVPKSPEERNYLGLSGGGSFKIPQIKAEVVVVQLFSMYCPFCQKDAPGVNEFYRMIEKSPDLKTRMKVIGIGTGNSPYEVGVFKKTYDVPFPLFPDKDFTIHKTCGEVRTPYYVVIKINTDGTHRIVLSQLGGFQGAELFLDSILTGSGLKQEDRR